jgi:hypothetical protein
MNHFLTGFADELVKEAGVAGSAFKMVRKHPIRSLIGASILGGTGMAASAGHKQGLRGGEKPRYLAASRNRPSRAALINSHELFDHKPSEKERKRPTKHHKASTFASYGGRPKRKKKG